MKTVDESERQTISERATQYFENGFHCAEAVATAVIEGLGQDPTQAAAHATAFGGGMGRTFLEACGALSGAFIVIGHLHGRPRPGGDWDLAAELGARIRQRFIDEFDTTQCAALRRRFGREQQHAQCLKLVNQVTADLLALLAQDPDQ